VRTNYEAKKLISNRKNIRAVWIRELGSTACEESGVFGVLLKKPENVPFQKELNLIGLNVPKKVLDKEKCHGLSGWQSSFGLIPSSHENSIVLSFREQEGHCRKKDRNTAQKEGGEQKRKKVKEKDNEKNRLLKVITSLQIKMWRN